ncbi:MAG: hypothetical protein IPI34_14280 [bacterium]|nr:hypothetical protein [bacterium]
MGNSEVGHVGWQLRPHHRPGPQPGDAQPGERRLRRASRLARSRRRPAGAGRPPAPAGPGLRRRRPLPRRPPGTDRAPGGDRGVEIFVHALLDGRDTDPHGGLQYVKDLEAAMAEIGAGRIATVGGRYYAMDRDKRWDRVESSYDAASSAQGPEALTGERSRFLLLRLRFAGGGVESGDDHADRSRRVRGAHTALIGRPTSARRAPGDVRDGDGGLLQLPHRPRPRAHLRLRLPDFKDFGRGPLTLGVYVCMTQYDESFACRWSSRPRLAERHLPDLIAAPGWRQLRIAETEKYAHVTFFFNGGREEAFGRDRGLVPTPRSTPTTCSPR